MASIALDQADEAFGDLLAAKLLLRQAKLFPPGPNKFTQRRHGAPPKTTALNSSFNTYAPGVKKSSPVGGPTLTGLCPTSLAAGAVHVPVLPHARARTVLAV